MMVRHTPTPDDPHELAGCGLLIVAGVLVWAVLIYLGVLILTFR
jgi:hypothetical protein